MSIVTYPLNETLYTAEDAAMYNFAISSGVATGDDFSCSVTGGGDEHGFAVNPGRTVLYGVCRDCRRKGAR